MGYRAVIIEAENEMGEMEKLPGRPCKCGICKGEQPPCMPGTDGRHDSAAGDHFIIGIIAEENWCSG